jgi:hypothetical protein
MNTTHRSPSLVRQDIEQTRRDMQSINLVDRSAIKSRIAHLTAKATIDNRHKADLVLALNELADADKAHSTHAALGDKLNKLLDEMNESTRMEGVAAREAAGRRMQEAEQDFNAHARAAAMAYAKLIIAARQCGSTKQLPIFDASSIRPISWNGPVSSIMAQSANPLLALPWMQPEREAA